MVARSRPLSKSLHSTELSLFCAIMTDARKSVGLTQTELARRLKKPQSFVAKYEGGERRLDVIEFLAITRAMDVDPKTLLRKLQKSL
jgi:transcriptional regulator with XRE-family HTH domain